MSDSKERNRIIWQGTRCRVVRRHIQSHLGYPSCWEYVFEKADGQDAMDDWRYRRANYSELPQEFFEDVICAFDVRNATHVVDKLKNFNPNPDLD